MLALIEVCPQSTEAGTSESPDYSLLIHPDERKDYYFQNGYLVRPRLIEKSSCERAVSSFRNEIKPYLGHLYRQASATPERHKFDGAKNILNSLLNPVSVNSRHFPGFRASSDSVLSDSRLFSAVEELLQDTAMLVQSMYFEANPATWPHQDYYYLDSKHPGGMVGAWIALEDIDEEVGRFYIIPGSHRLTIGRNRGRLNIASHHERYKQTIVDAIRERSLELRAPALKCGDVLFWNSRTIHGALKPVRSGKTRNSYTAHFIPESSRLVQYQCIPITMLPEHVGKHAVCRPKNQDRVFNRWIMAVETKMPRAFRFAKRKLISWKIKQLAP